MAFTYAGQYTEVVLGTSAAGFAVALPALTVNVYTVGTTTAVTLYTSRTKGSTASNPVSTDVNGNLTFYANPGQYDIVFTPPGGSQKRITVMVPQDPAEDSATYVPAWVLTNTATTDITVDIAAAIAGGATHIVIPNKGSTWPMLTKLTASNVTIEFRQGAQVSCQMDTEAFDLTGCRLLGPWYLTSPFTGPSSTADGDGTNNHYGWDGGAGIGEVYPRSVTLRTGCTANVNWYQEYASAGIQMSGTGIRITGSLHFKNIRHRYGWASSVHTHGTSTDCVVDAPVWIENADRGCETEEGSTNIRFTSGGKMSSVFPNGYTGQPGLYATYTFCLDAHAHTGEGGPQNIRYEGTWELTNCGAGVTCIRSSGTNASDLASDCWVEEVHFIGYGMSTGYEAIALQGTNCRVGRAVFEVGSGISGGSFRIKGYANSVGNSVDSFLVKTAAAFPIITEAGSGLTFGPSGTELVNTVSHDPGVIASISAGSAPTWPTANAAMFVRMNARRTMNIGKLIWLLGTQSGNYDIGLYDADGNRLWSKGSTAVPATATNTETVTAGAGLIQHQQTYYVACAADSTTAWIKGIASASAELTKNLRGVGVVLQVNTSFPLPATVDFSTATTPSRVPLITVRES